MIGKRKSERDIWAIKSLKFLYHLYWRLTYYLVNISYIKTHIIYSSESRAKQLSQYSNWSTAIHNGDHIIHSVFYVIFISKYHLPRLPAVSKLSKAESAKYLYIMIISSFLSFNFYYLFILLTYFNLYLLFKVLQVFPFFLPLSPSSLLSMHICSKFFS